LFAPVGAWIVPGARFLQPVAFPQQGHCYRITLIHVLRFRANDLCFGANVGMAFKKTGNTAPKGAVGW
jgi:hypothetical protein